MKTCLSKKNTFKNEKHDILYVEEWWSGVGVSRIRRDYATRLDQLSETAYELNLKKNIM